MQYRINKGHLLTIYNDPFFFVLGSVSIHNGSKRCYTGLWHLRTWRGNVILTCHSGCRTKYDESRYSGDLNCIRGRFYITGLRLKRRRLSGSWLKRVLSSHVRLGIYTHSFLGRRTTKCWTTQHSEDILRAVGISIGGKSFGPTLTYERWYENE